MEEFIRNRAQRMDKGAGGVFPIRYLRSSGVPTAQGPAD